MAISQANGNISEAARILGVPRDYIRYRLKKKNF
jgi:DNA-binding protein Fis